MHLNRHQSVFLFLYLILLMFTLTGRAQTAPLKIVTEFSPPHQIIENEQVSGLATQKVQAILQQANVKAPIDIYPWARAYRKASNEPNTLIYSMAKTEERAPLFYWLAPVAQYKFGWVSLQDRKDIVLNELAEAKQYRIVVQRDDISHLWLIKQGFIEDKHFITCADIGCSWQLLINKNVDLIIESVDLIDDMLQRLNHPLDSVQFISYIPELEITAYLAANRNIDPSLLSRLQVAISTLNQE